MTSTSTSVPTGRSRSSSCRRAIKSLWLDLVTRKLPIVPTSWPSDLAPGTSVAGILLLYSETPASGRRFFEAVHGGRVVPSVHGDFLGVVTQNAEGNKIDWYLRRSIDYRAVLNRTTDQIHGLC